MVAAALAGSAAVGLTGAIMQSGAATDAASMQADAANNAAGLQFQATNNALAQQQGMFNTTQANLSPYMNMGQLALGTAGTLANAGPTYSPYTFQPFDMSEAGLQATPGYQFTLDQGLKATQNSSIAQGASGNAIRAADQYATGLADSTYNQQFANWQTQQSNLLNANVTNFNAAQSGFNTNYNRLLSLAGLGENAAAGVGQAATQTGTSMANTLIGGTNAAAGSLIGGANASAAGTIGSANAISNGLSGAGNNATNMLYMNALLSQNGGSGLFGNGGGQVQYPF